MTVFNSGTASRAGEPNELLHRRFPSTKRKTQKKKIGEGEGHHFVFKENQIKIKENIGSGNTQSLPDTGFFYGGDMETSYIRQKEIQS